MKTAFNGGGGGGRKAEHLEKKKIFGPKVFDYFGQIIFWLTFYNFFCVSICVTLPSRFCNFAELFV